MRITVLALSLAIAASRVRSSAAEVPPVVDTGAAAGDAPPLRDTGVATSSPGSADAGVAAGDARSLPDAGVAPSASGPADAGVVAGAAALGVVAADAAAPAIAQPAARAAPVRSPAGYRYASLSVAIASWAGAGVFGVLAYRARSDANALYVSDPRFDDERGAYSTYRWLALGSIGLGVIATSFAIYLFELEPAATATQRSFQLGAGDGSIGVTYGGAL